MCVPSGSCSRSGWRWPGWQRRQVRVERRGWRAASGGGFVVDESAAGADRIVADTTPLAHPFRSGDELLAQCRDKQLSISQLMLENERAWRSDAETRAGLLKIWDVMQLCVRRGCEREGIMPGVSAEVEAWCRSCRRRSW